MSESVYQPGLLAYVFDPFDGVAISEGARAEAASEVADYVRESALSAIGSAKSPVAGRGSFQALSKAYAKEKSEQSSSPVANLELNGDMLDALKVTVRPDGKLAYGIEGPEAEKADGHCQLTGRESELPVRRFIPGPGETFAPDIQKGIREIVSKYAQAENSQVFRSAIAEMMGLSFPPNE